ncbi:hypothetical protein CSC89_20370 [Klebsiella pneumoniae]|nr:hypothetical protein CSC89_20370 [Klebsiella pneumoniae]
MPALNSGHTIGHITAPHLIWFRYGELSLKMIRIRSRIFPTTQTVPWQSKSSKSPTGPPTIKPSSTVAP